MRIKQRMTYCSSSILPTVVPPLPTSSFSLYSHHYSIIPPSLPPSSLHPTRPPSSLQPICLHPSITRPALPLHSVPHLRHRLPTFLLFSSCLHATPLSASMFCFFFYCPTELLYLQISNITEPFTHTHTLTVQQSRRENKTSSHR